jgi:hypothetical protein
MTKYAADFMCDSNLTKIGDNPACVVDNLPDKFQEGFYGMPF